MKMDRPPRPGISDSYPWNTLTVKATMEAVTVVVVLPMATWDIMSLTKAAKESPDPKGGVQHVYGMREKF